LPQLARLPVAGLEVFAKLTSLRYLELGAQVAHALLQLLLAPIFLIEFVLKDLGFIL
jgi:hypothetical protein